MFSSKIQLAVRRKCFSYGRLLSCFPSTPASKSITSSAEEDYQERGRKEKSHQLENIVNGKPTLEYARQMKTSHSSMTNTDIIHLSSEGDVGARQEALIRNIMSVDSVEHDKASLVLQEILRTNKSLMHGHSIPYVAGLVVTLTAGTVSVPLVFDKTTATWFNDRFVTMDPPAPGEVETILEVGSWTWAWMEPIIGQISFFLLTLQFARNQLINIGIKPYGNMIRHHRASKLIEKYPRYDSRLLTNVASSVNYMDA